MKFRVILCIALLILFGLGVFNDSMGRQKAPSPRGHTWQGECSSYPNEIQAMRSSSENVRGIFLFLTISRAPFGFYINVLQTVNSGCKNPKKVPERNKENRDVGANKNFSRRDQ